MNSIVKNTRTDTQTVQLILTRIVQGVQHKYIAEEVGMSVSGIKKVKKRNLDALPEIRQQVIAEQGRYATRILQKTLRELEMRLDDSISGKNPLPVKELVSIAKETFSQAQINNSEPTAIVRSNLLDDNAEAMRLALETNNVVELANLVFP